MRRTRMKTFTLALLFAGVGISTGSAQQVRDAVKAVQVTGLVGVKDNAKGSLSVENGNLQFAHAKGISKVSATAIEDVASGADTQAAIGKTASTVSMAAPYGGGRFLALFRNKIDTITIQFRDAEGGLHGAIFTMPQGAAETIKTELLAQGAHAVARQAPAAGLTSSMPSTQKEQK